MGNLWEYFELDKKLNKYFQFWWYKTKRDFCDIKNLGRITKRICPVFLTHPLHSDKFLDFIE